MYFTPYLSQTIPQVTEGLNTLNEATTNAIIVILVIALTVAVFIIGGMVKSLIDFFRASTEAQKELAKISGRQEATTQTVATELNKNNEATLATKQIVGEIKGMVETSNTNTAATATKVADIDTKIAQISSDVGKALTEIADLRTAIASNAKTDTELMNKVDALALQMATALTELREIKSDLHAKPQITNVVTTAAPASADVSKDSFDKENG